MIYAVLLAAGSGSRMKTSTIPKQFLEIRGEPILRLAVDKFLACPRIESIVVVAPSIWMSHTRDVLSHPRYAACHVCEGGKTRQESLYNAVRYIDERYETSDSDLVISHDVARPFVSLRVIEENIRALERFDACDTVIPATDTIVVSEDNTLVSAIPDRRTMYQGQTPQSFRLKTYLRLYATLDKDYLDRVTDAARILKENGCTVGLVQGDVFNIKITTEYDFNIASFLIGAVERGLS